MKRICFINSTPFWGGGEKTHLKFALKLREKGYQVFFIVKNNSPLAKEAQKNNIRVYSTNIGNLSFINPLKLFKLILFFKKEKIDTLLFSSSNDFKTGGLAGKIAKLIRIVYLRGVAAPIKKSMVNSFLFRNVLNHIIASSEETKRAVLKHLSDTIPENKVSVIYRGIDIQEYDKLLKSSPKTNYKTKENEIILGNAGRLSSEKAQHYLIDLAVILKQKNIPFKIMVAGEGPRRNELEDKIKEHALQKHVILLGFIKNIASFMKSIDVFVFTSTTEGFGNVLIEAGSASKPILAFNMSTNPEIITSGENGFLVNHPDINAMSKHIISLSQNRDEITRLGKNFRKTVEERFQLDDIIDEITACLLSLKEL